MSLECFICRTTEDVDPILFNTHQHGTRPDELVALCPLCCDAMQQQIDALLIRLRRRAQAASAKAARRVG